MTLTILPWRPPLYFDPTLYRPTISCHNLTTSVMDALKKHTGDRSEKDATVLSDVLLHLPMFAQYPKSVKQDLALQLWYDTFQEGRIIIKQGDPETRVYFVISGEVDLKRTETDVLTERNYTSHVRTVEAGGIFGELNMMSNTKCEFTAICKGTSEILSLSKDDFNHALRSQVEGDWTWRFNFLRSSEHFTAWTDKQLEALADSSHLREYTDNSVILGNTNGHTDSVYLIKKGRCDMYRRIFVEEHQSIPLPKIASQRPETLSQPYCRIRTLNKHQIQFMTAASLHTGDYFGVGENLRNSFILARGSQTEVLVINAAEITIQGMSAHIRELAKQRENDIPSGKAVYKDNKQLYEYRNCWFEMKDLSIVRNLISHRVL